MSPLRRCAVWLLAWVLAAPAAAVDVAGLDLEAVATGLDAPLGVVSAGDDRLFVVLQGGRVAIYDGGRLLNQPFLDLRDKISSGGERGLLGLAFHPDYADNGFFFVDYADPAGNTVIARYSVSADPGRADPASGAVLLEIAQPFANHNGGQLQFGPDGFLYVGMGDGGSANDPGCRAQNGGELLGKLLRLDVDQNVGTPPFHGIPPSNPFVGDAAVRDEIWALGLRNPWRFSFDRETGDLVIADVGQGAIEEVDVQPAASAGGLNYGWKVMEGSRCTGNASGCAAGVPACGAPELTLPEFEYDHSNGRCSITGGYVYRGSALPQLAGAYVYGDYCTGEVWAAEQTGGGWQRAKLDPRVPRLTSFGEDARGELWAVAGDTLYRLTGPDACFLEPGDPRYCAECGPCDEGAGGCGGDDDCRAGLICAADFGDLFGLDPATDVCLVPGGLPAPVFQAIEVPAAETPTGPLTEVLGQEINNARQVVGLAQSAEPGDLRSVGFRFSPDAGLEVLDPRGNQSAKASRINQRGDVYGVLFTPAGNRRNGVFVHRQDGGFDLLQDGSTSSLRRTFQVAGLSEAGDLVGSALRKRTVVPYVYRDGEGWSDVSRGHPELRTGGDAYGVAFNDAGDILLMTRPSGLELRAFLLHDGGLIELGDFGGGATQPGAMNGRGRIAGLSFVDRETFHAFVVARPGSRMIDVHLRAFVNSAALAVNARGVVAGVLDSTGSGSDALFDWDPRRRPRAKILARRGDFLALFGEPDSELKGIEVFAVNERLEFVGSAFFGDGPEARMNPFYSSPAYGLLDVGELLAATGFAGRATAAVDLDDRGALLLWFERDGEKGSVVLIP